MLLEISSHSYLEFVVDLLRHHEGVMLTSTVEAEVEKAFSPYFSDADFRSLRNRKRLKWQNALDWAKAVGTGKRLFRTTKYQKQKYIVLLDPDITDERWLKRASKIRPKKTFFKYCRHCVRHVVPRSKARNPLKATACRRCGRPFPKPNERHDVTPGE